MRPRNFGRQARATWITRAGLAHAGTPTIGPVYDGAVSSYRPASSEVVNGAHIEVEMPAQSQPRRSAADVGSSYYYRRALTSRELLPAAGIALGAGLVAFYFATLFLARTPLVPETTLASSGRRGPRRGRDRISPVRGG